MARTKKTNGLVLYKGPSLLDGRPIVVILTGLAKDSQNPKTGAMCQTWILRADMHPVDALRTGSDISICGTCLHRPLAHPDETKIVSMIEKIKAIPVLAKHHKKLFRRLERELKKTRSCYVGLYGPSTVYQAWLRGNYPDYVPAEHNHLLRRPIRFGAYGDPAAAPYSIWSKLERLATTTRSYTHAWRTCDPRLARISMASADFPGDVAEANAAGWRTFRVKEECHPVLPNEIVCPASEERGKVRTCLTCSACKGAGNGHNVTIDVHGRKGTGLAYLVAVGRVGRIALDLV